MNHLEFLFAGYAVAWAAVFAYVWLLWRRLASVQRRLDSVERRVSDA